MFVYSRLYMPQCMYVCVHIEYWILVQMCCVIWWSVDISNMNQEIVCARVLCFSACAYKRMPMDMQDTHTAMPMEGGAHTPGLENQE